jgi:hypothetical protein
MQAIKQPNSDPAFVKDIAQNIVSLGDSISSRIRNGNSNFYDIRVLHECIKSLDSICFGQNPQIQGDSFVSITYVEFQL